MKKILDLQLFAEDTPSASGADSATDTKPTGNNNTDKEPGRETKAEPKYTDADLDRIIDQKFAEWQKKKQKEVDEAKKLAEMNAQQKAEYERDQLRKEIDDYKRKDSISEMSKTARKMLADSGISISDDLLSMLVTTDAAKTKAAVDGFAKSFNEAVEKAVKEKLKGEPPRKGSGNAPTMTKEQIMAIRDPELRQKKMLEHRELFNL